MHKIDWRSPAEYRFLQNYDRAGFAWEIVRRNRDYCREYKKILLTKPPDPLLVESFVKRWGLRFRL
ncbi:transcriptional regulator domain-containing protein [Sphingopyxis granuli]|uniref:Transcriptional regulator-like domain-containing protein n=1 Tax=Sphingopyxis granuli TaxID=267128 RepID=A0AA86GXC1_9SPHN|nr:DUF6499 domain-containing protein [Sphingopyxis granuli]AMG76547.1 Uncharacterized protein SGRAN_4221 [Sphingopyxis granuli]